MGEGELDQAQRRPRVEGACWSSALETDEAPPSRAQWIPRGAQRGDALHRFLARQPRSSTFYLAGQASSVQAMRRRLLSLGVARRLIRTKTVELR